MAANFPTPDAYLEALPADRRELVGAIREVIRANLPAGYAEGMQYGMIGYFVPHALYPAGYHCDPAQPLPFAGIGSQKSHVGLYLFCVYLDPALTAWFTDAWRAAGKKLDMGKSCVRVKKLEDVPLGVIGELVRRVPVAAFVEHYEASRGAAKPSGGGGSGPTKKTSATKKASATKNAAASKTAKKTAVTKKAGAGSRGARSGYS